MAAKRLRNAAGNRPVSGLDIVRDYSIPEAFDRHRRQTDQTGILKPAGKRCSGHGWQGYDYGFRALRWEIFCGLAFKTPVPGVPPHSYRKDFLSRSIAI